MSKILNLLSMVALGFLTIVAFQNCGDGLVVMESLSSIQNEPFFTEDSLDEDLLAEEHLPSDIKGPITISAYENNFNQNSIGVYSAETMDEDWNNPPFSQGVEDGRVEIIEDKVGGKKNFLRVHYPKDSFSNKNTGAQWKLKLDKKYEELYVEYELRFAQNFDFVKGGKLPGLAGGTAPTGGKEANGENGWSGRMMWRREGHIVQYMYYPDQPEKYGDDFDWIGCNKTESQPCPFKRAQWQKVKTYFKMNTPGQRDGIVTSWYNGERVLHRTDVLFRTVKDLGIDLFYFSTFFGGSDSTWSSTADTYVDYDNFKIYELE